MTVIKALSQSQPIRVLLHRCSKSSRLFSGLIVTLCCICAMLLPQCTAQVQPTATTITTYATQVPQGNAVTFTATVSGGTVTPTGMITMFDGVTTLGSSSLDNTGAASVTTAVLSAGPHLISASYSGDANYATSTSPVVNVTVTGLAPGTVLFGQTDFSSVSVSSWYNDNWYQLGTGYSGTLQAITVKCYVDWNYWPNSGALSLQEFSDSHYSVLLNSYELDGNGNPTCISTPVYNDVTFTNLNIILNPSSYYRLYTTAGSQNASVRLFGSPNSGYAMFDSFVYGVGRVENYYTFYPYMVPYVIVDQPPQRSCPPEQSDHSNGSPHNPAKLIVDAAMVVNAVGLWVAPGGGVYWGSESYLTILQDVNGTPGAVLATSTPVTLGARGESGPPGEAFYSFPNPPLIPASTSFWIQLNGGPSSTSNGTAYYGSVSPPATPFFDFQATCLSSSAISVSTNLPATTFSIAGPINLAGGGTSSTFSDVPVGTYTITFAAVPGYITPSQQTQTLTAGEPISFTGIYDPVAGSGLGPGGSSQNPVVMYAEPVDTQNGNYFYQHTDLSIPGRGLSLTFSRSYNALSSYAGPLGHNWNHSFNVALTDSGSSVATSWEDGHIEYYWLMGGTYVPSLGVYNTLVKNADGTYLLTKRDQTAYAFSSAGKLASITDKNGNSISLTYSFSGNLTQVTDTVGRVLTLTYDKSNRISTIVDPIGRKESVKYSAANDLVSVTDFLKGVTTFAYDTAHHVTSITLPGNAPLLTNVYDSSGRIISQTNADKFTSTFAYDTPAPGQTTVTDPLGNPIVYTYDDSLRIVQITDALNGTISYGYDANNNRTSVTNQNGKTTNFTYGAMGNVLSTTDPLGNQTSFSYDARNDLLTSTTANGATATFTYDGNGNLTSVQDALSHVTKFSYDSFGELASKTDANNNTTNYGYDSYGDLTTTTDALSHATTMGYDGVGRLTSVTDANGNKTTLSYDALGRLVGTADALGDATQYKYSLAGNLVKVTDADNNATVYDYDAARNLTSVTDAAKHTTKYTYDANNNRISFTNGNAKKTTYAYDKLNRLSTITDPLQFITAYSYDPVGNVASIADANGHGTQFTYDAVNRLTGISYFDGSTVGYGYDPDGNRTSMVDSRGTTSYTYDTLDRMSGVVQPGGATVTYSYDAIGHRIGLSYPDGNAVSYSYDAANRLNNVTDWLNRSTVYNYDPANRLLSTSYPNAASISYAYDSANRLTNVTNTYPSIAISPTGQFSAFTYALDKVGNRTSVTDGNGSTTSYAYDARYELTGATSPFGAAKYTYDAVGNRLTLTAKSGTTNYKYDPDDRLLSAGKTSFVCDKNGNRIGQKATGQTLAYAYDAANRLVSVTGGTQASAFTYDGDGHRVTQTVGSGTYTYSNDVATALPVVLEENGPDGLIDYNYGQGLISESSSQFDYFYHKDGLGSVVGLTDDSGALDQGYAYDSWGVDTGTQNVVGTANKFRYTGQALDPGTAFYFLRARYYDGTFGRLITKDPLNGSVLKPLTMNRFIYSLNSPIGLSDPSGLTAEDGNANSTLPIAPFSPARGPSGPYQSICMTEAQLPRGVDVVLDLIGLITLDFKGGFMGQGVLSPLDPFGPVPSGPGGYLVPIPCTKGLKA